MEEKALRSHSESDIYTQCIRIVSYLSTNMLNILGVWIRIPQVKENHCYLNLFILI